MCISQRVKRRHDKWIERRPGAGMRHVTPAPPAATTTAATATTVVVSDAQTDPLLVN
jgi:hypothetical protein